MSKERDMAEENEAVEAKDEPTTTDADPNDATVEGGETQQAQPDPEIEERARRMGWAPQDEFKGDPKRWVDAETFVQRGEEIMPILKANTRKLEADNTELRQTLKDLTDHMQRSEQRMYQKALKDLQAAQRKAAEAGDLAQYDQLEQQKHAMVKEVAQSQGPKAGGDEVDPVTKEWVAERRWFREDKEMATWATSHHDFLLRTKPGLTLEENLAEVDKAVRKAFPEKFSNPKRNGHSPVEGNPAPKTRGGKGYADLPADAKAACDRLVKQGVLKKDEYVKDYFSE